MPSVSPSTSSRTSGAPEHQPTDLRLEVGPMANGGHCVARHDGRVVFVRHAIPGEIVTARVTEAAENARFWRADTVDVVRPSEFRRAHQWKLADSVRAYAAGRQPVGGAEFGHITLEHQRRLKAQVFRDTMDRLAKIQVEAPVIGMPDDEPTGLNWRTRNAFAVNALGRISKHVHRSANIIPVRNIPLAVPELDELHLWDIDFSGATRLEVATNAQGSEVLIVIFPEDGVGASAAVLKAHCESWRKRVARLPEHVSVVVGVRTKKFGALSLTRLRGRTWIDEFVETEKYGSRHYRISGDGFWQVHRQAPATLVNGVLDTLDAQPGQVIADLYGGVGLFSGFIADQVTEDGMVLSVEAAPGASRDARKNLYDVPQAVVLNGRTDKIVGSWLQRPEAAYGEGGLNGQSVDAVVLDPPRAGAGRAAIDRIDQLNPDKIVYVSCDPACFARDAGWLVEKGWQLDDATIYDLFPDTYHMETLSVFTRGH